MLKSELLKKAKIVAGIGVLEDNQINENQNALTETILDIVLNDINNDSSITLLDTFVNLPFGLSQASNEYVFYEEYNRVKSIFDNQVEWTHVPYQEVIRERANNGIRTIWSTTYADGNLVIVLSRIATIKAIVTRKIKFTVLPLPPGYDPENPPKPEYEFNSPQQIDSYLIYRLAQDLALSFNTNSYERCKRLADNAYIALKDIAEFNSGIPSINQNLSFARFEEGSF